MFLGIQYSNRRFKSQILCSDYDAWLFSDFALLHSLAPQSPKKYYLAFLQKLFQTKTNGEASVAWRAHSPHKSQIILSVGQRTSHRSIYIKARFLEALPTSVQATTPVDRLVVIIVGHGVDDQSVGVGKHRQLQRNRYPSLLRPEEVEYLSFRSLGWASSRTWFSRSRTQTHHAKCQAQDEIWSHKVSESVCVWGALCHLLWILLSQVRWNWRREKGLLNLATWKLISCISIS